MFSGQLFSFKDQQQFVLYFELGLQKQLDLSRSIFPLPHTSSEDAQLKFDTIIVQFSRLFSTIIDNIILFIV